MTNMVGNKIITEAVMRHISCGTITRNFVRRFSCKSPSHLPIKTLYLYKPGKPSTKNVFQTGEITPSTYYGVTQQLERMACVDIGEYLDVRYVVDFDKYAPPVTVQTQHKIISTIAFESQQFPNCSQPG